jgi:PAS domain S-box-containing protein
LSPRVPWWLLLAGLVALDLTNPFTWGRSPPHTWFPPAGIGLALIAWFGVRGTLLVLVGLLLPVVQGFVLDWFFSTPNWGALALQLSEVLLLAAQLQLAWALYSRSGNALRGARSGARTLGDPRSVVLFLLFVVGLAPAFVAVLRATGQWLHPGPAFTGFGTALLEAWLSQALGLIVVAPVLLVTTTPWLVQRGYALPEAVDDPQEHRGVSLDQPTPGDWVETLGLAAAAGLLGVLLAALKSRMAMDAWQLWGAPLLLIVWASLRQGMRGSTLSAGAAAGLPLLVSFGPGVGWVHQANLLALCSTALLVASAATWVRHSEARYRQVVAHVPVVIYSGRILNAGVSNEEKGASLTPDPSPLAPGSRVPQAEVTLVSAACQALLGCNPERLLGRYENWLRQVHPDDREILQAALVQLTRQKQPVTCEYRLAPEQGVRGHGAGGSKEERVAALTPDLSALTPVRVRWVRDTLAPHFDAEGRLLGWEGVVTEITEQRVLADDLRRTTSMFHALVTNLPAGVFFVQGPSGRPILVNARARQLLGQREEVAVGVSHLAQTYRLHRPDGTPYPPQELPVYQALRYGQTTMRNDIVVHRPDGRRMPLITWAAPVQLNSQTQPDAAVWVLEDLTALQQAETARRESEQRLRAIVETLGEGLMVQDRRGCILDANTAACAMLERTPDELRGRSMFELDWDFLREDGTLLPQEEHPSQRVQQTGQPARNVVLGLVKRAESEELRAQSQTDPSGSLQWSAQQAAAALRSPLPARWFLVNARPLLPGQAGRGVVTTFAEITAYRQAQEVFRTSEERYRELVEALPLVLLVTDRDLQVVYTNPATKAISGYELAEFAAPANWATRVHPEDLPQIHENARQTLAGQSCRFEVRYRAKDGSQKVGFVMTQPRWQDGQIVGAVSLILDVTRERQLEQELQRSQRLELIGQLSSGIAHDFKNLLGVMITLTGLARKDLSPGDPVHDTLGKIEGAAEHAASLANQLLAFGKRASLAPAQVAIHQVIRRTLDLVRPTLPAGIEVRAELDERDLVIEIDETQLQQVLLNLCLNARDAMLQAPPAAAATCRAPESGGEGRGTATEGQERRFISVQTAAVCCQNGATEATVSRWVRLTVQDQGHGMNETVKARLFSPFFTTKENGTGLGLTVVQHIVESYGGRIEVASQVGEGTRFDVWLPQHPSTLRPHPAAGQDLGAQI